LQALQERQEKDRSESRTHLDAWQQELTKRASWKVAAYIERHELKYGKAEEPKVSEDEEEEEGVETTSEDVEVESEASDSSEEFEASDSSEGYEAISSSEEYEASDSSEE
jgi:hypothetical protein